jgi:hypothetical protein
MYRGLDEESIEQYVRIAGETADTITKELTRESVFDPVIVEALTIVERTIRNKRLVVYGGTALNAILPKKVQFYDPEYDLPDWDFFSDNPIPIAMDIADKVLSKTGSDSSVTTAAHEGTYKVFANGQAIADITYVPKNVLKMLREYSIVKDGIHYTGPEYLRMGAYLELSRPLGQPERWDKVMRRISLLNREYPVHIPKRKDKIEDYVKKEKDDLLSILLNIQDTKTGRENGNGSVFAFIGPEVFTIVRNVLSKRGVSNMRVGSIPGGIMIISPNPEKTVDMILENGGGVYKVVKREGSGEILGEQYVIYSGSSKKEGYELCTVIGVNNACQSIYTIKIRHDNKVKSVRIGSVETMLYVYNSFVFAKDTGVFKDHNILRAIDSLIKLHIRILKIQKKPLIPLPVECIGKQETIKDMRDTKKNDIKKILAERGRTSVEYVRRNIRYEAGDKNMRRIIERSFEREKEHQALKLQ